MRAFLPRASWIPAVALTLCAALPAGAQATRTWVSGVGDDANPCSRTAPCKTFAGSISKTAAGGEINVLDPGGFGGVTITKSISIISDGFEAGVLVSGTNGIIVNAGTGDVYLRGLDLEGLGTGLNGIFFVSGGSLTVEKCTIQNFSQRGIDFPPSAKAKLTVIDTTIRGQNNATNGGAIWVHPSGGLASVVLERVRMDRNLFGLRVEETVRAVANDSIAVNSIAEGFGAIGTAAGPTLFLTRTVSSFNATGLRSEGLATARTTDSVFSGNTNGLVTASGGTLISYGTNENDGSGAPTMTVARQ
ncbi:MAG: right-handed parallel beta-helix repeat-containing protein [Acidobacteriota bacterium]